MLAPTALGSSSLPHEATRTVVCLGHSDGWQGQGGGGLHVGLGPLHSLPVLVAQATETGRVVCGCLMHPSGPVSNMKAPHPFPLLHYFTFAAAFCLHLAARANTRKNARKRVKGG